MLKVVLIRRRMSDSLRTPCGPSDAEAIAKDGEFSLDEEDAALLRAKARSSLSLD